MTLALSIDRKDKMVSLKDKIQEMEKKEILDALTECGWVMSRAAKNLGITERMIGYKIRKYGIRREGYIEERLAK